MGAALKLPISPLAGEMPGRAEGRAVPPASPHVANRSDHLDGRRSTLPSSGLPAISPLEGEIGSFDGGAR